jgi:hypothetical protein
MYILHLRNTETPSTAQSFEAVQHVPRLANPLIELVRNVLEGALSLGQPTRQGEMVPNLC